ncbi:MAG TPA: TlpA disulfide reductase family protein [Bryobacteraceae bacterium]|jgi:cytochrome c biogenesis protein CcmG/thiol:disulfide interchange protein DsbE|nr:TlpA disulfide reductase family protein [Bryobacteraceae bacterium]
MPPLRPANERQPAPQFALQDSFGRTIHPNEYRGRVVLLDFWATWCTGCKEEIPWFSAFQKTYGEQGLAVVGVSMDEGGWNVLRPFLAKNPIPCTIVLGDNTTAQRYSIDSLPDTFLIDRNGKIAAAYKAGLVDRSDIEANLKALLANH